jgi:hypothetical protein
MRERGIAPKKKESYASGRSKTSRTAGGKAAKNIQKKCESMRLLRTNPSAQVLYDLGRWTWCYRLPALIAYAFVPPLFVAVCFTVQDLMRSPSIRDAGGICFLGLFFFLISMYWHSLQSQATRITLLPDRALLIVRTINLTYRRIPISALEDVHYEAESSSDETVFIPVLTVQVRGRVPIKIDLDGRIPNERAFKAIFYKSLHFGRHSSLSSRL